MIVPCALPPRPPPRTRTPLPREHTLGTVKSARWGRGGATGPASYRQQRGVGCDDHRGIAALEEKPVGGASVVPAGDDFHQGAILCRRHPGRGQMLRASAVSAWARLCAASASTATDRTQHLFVAIHGDAVKRIARYAAAVLGVKVPGTVAVECAGNRGPRGRGRGSVHARAVWSGAADQAGARTDAQT